jgi:hypothetical protein
MKCFSERPPIPFPLRTYKCTYSTHPSQVPRSHIQSSTRTITNAITPSVIEKIEHAVDGTAALGWFAAVEAAAAAALPVEPPLSAADEEGFVDASEVDELNDLFSGCGDSGSSSLFEESDMEPVLFLAPTLSHSCISFSTGFFSLEQCFW